MPESVPGTIATPAEIKVEDIPAGEDVPPPGGHTYWLARGSHPMSLWLTGCRCGGQGHRGLPACRLQRQSDNCVLCATCTGGFFFPFFDVETLRLLCGEPGGSLYDVLTARCTSVGLQENVTNTFAAFSSSNDKGFASPEEFQMRVEVFKENIVQLQALNTNLSDYIVGVMIFFGSAHVW
jgi:hypothetical protein